MARKAKQPEITVISYVRRQNGEKVRVEDLNLDEKEKLAGWIKTTWLNELYKGVAVFSVAERGAAP